MDFQINDKVKYLNKVLCEVEKIYQGLLTKNKLSDSEYVLLFSILELGEGCLQKDIAQNSYISKKTLNSTVKKLEQDGLITLKSGKYPNMHIYLTSKGHEYIKTKVIPIIETENKIMNGITDDEFENFYTTTSKYIKIFEQNVN